MSHGAHRFLHPDDADPDDPRFVSPSKLVDCDLNFSQKVIISLYRNEAISILKDPSYINSTSSRIMMDYFFKNDFWDFQELCHDILNDDNNQTRIGWVVEALDPLNLPSQEVESLLEYSANVSSQNLIYNVDSRQLLYKIAVLFIQSGVYDPFEKNEYAYCKCPN